MLAVTPSLAQEPEMAGEAVGPGISELLTVELVEVDVVVLDRRGRPVEGLGRDDFELFLDGRRVAIVHFQGPEPDVGTTAGGGAQTTAGPVPSAMSPGHRERPHIVLLFDHHYLAPGATVRLVEELRPLLAGIAARGGRIMILDHDQAVRVVATYTDEPDEIQRALAEVATGFPRGLALERERLSALRDLVHAVDTCPPWQREGDHPCDRCDHLLLSRARAYAADAHRARQQSAAALSQAIALLGGLGEPSQLVYVGGGLPVHAGLEVFHFLLDLCQTAQRVPREIQGELAAHSAMTLLREIAAAANAQRITLHTLDARGLEAPGAASVEHDFAPSSVQCGSSRAGRGVDNVTGTSARTQSTLNDDVRKANTQSSLFALADETGGQAILDSNEPARELEALLGETRGTYVLGFSPDHAVDGAIHQVVVKTTTRTHVLRHRRSFRHATREEIVGERTLAARLLGVEENPLRASAAWLVPGEGEEARSGVELRLPGAELTTLAEEGHRRGLVTVMLAVPRPDGQGTDVRRKELPVRLLAEEEVLLVVELDLPAGEHQLGVGVWDRFADRAAFLSLEATNPAAAPP